MAQKTSTSESSGYPFLQQGGGGGSDSSKGGGKGGGGGGGGFNPFGWVKKVPWTKLAGPVSKAGQIAAAMAARRAEARQAEIDALLRQDQSRLSFEENRRRDDRNQLDFEENRRRDDSSRLDFEQFNLQAPQWRAKNAGRGDLLAGVQDVQLTRPRGGGVRGGTRPSLLSAESRALGKAMARQALLSQLSGPLSPTAPGQGPMQPSAPGSSPVQPTPLPQSGKLDKILTGVGYGGLVAGAFGGDNQAPPPSSAPSSYDPFAPVIVPEDRPLPPGNPGQPGFGGWAPKSRQYVNPNLGAKFYAPQF